MIGQSNLGESEHDFRVPDGALHRSPPAGVWHPTAALVIEIVSPGDESWEKLPSTPFRGSAPSSSRPAIARFMATLLPARLGPMRR
jgi:hypothetical protein